MHDDYVEEYPQSGERIRGKQTARTVNDNYPGGLPNMVDLSFEVNGNLGVLELLVEYDGNQVHICEIVELQDAKIKRGENTLASRLKQRSGERRGSKGCSVGSWLTCYSANHAKKSPWLPKIAHLGDVPASPGRVW
jgi:hypothetical protein